MNAQLDLAYRFLVTLQDDDWLKEVSGRPIGNYIVTHPHDPQIFNNVMAEKLKTYIDRHSIIIWLRTPCYSMVRGLIIPTFFTVSQMGRLIKTFYKASGVEVKHRRDIVDYTGKGLSAYHPDALVTTLTSAKFELSDKETESDSEDGVSFERGEPKEVVKTTRARRSSTFGEYNPLRCSSSSDCEEPPAVRHTRLRPSPNRSDSEQDNHGNDCLVRGHIHKTEKANVLYSGNPSLEIFSKDTDKEQQSPVTDNEVTRIVSEQTTKALRVAGIKPPSKNRRHCK